MKEIKEKLEKRLKDLLNCKTTSLEKENLIANTAKTYMNSIMIIEDYIKEEQINIRGDYMKNLASKNVDLNIKPLCVNEVLNKLADTFTQMHQTLYSVEIHDAGYSKEFREEVENALITVAVIKAFGIGKQAERYLGVVKKVVRELNTAPSKGK